MKCANLNKPQWLKLRVKCKCDTYDETERIVKKHRVRTICADGLCPNIRTCWGKKHAAFMILGDICTRRCTFCNIPHGDPKGCIDHNEPYSIACAARAMELKHIVITSVTRDDLRDGGAKQFVECITSIRSLNNNITIEVLTPDFYKKIGALESIAHAKPDVFNHNLETVSSLYAKIKPGANYTQKLNLLQKVKEIDEKIFTKSGIMLGLGENIHEVEQTMDDLRCAGVDFLTIGQYLPPSPTHMPVYDYVHPEIFSRYEEMAYRKGFIVVASSPLTRSSYHADDLFIQLKERKIQQNTTK